MRMSAAVMAAYRRRRSAVIWAALSPCFRRCSKGSKIAHICPELDWLLNPLPSIPAYTEADDTPGVSRVIPITCCTMASVRASVAPTGSCTEMETLPWSCGGMKPRGVSMSRQPASTSRPA